MAMFLVDLLGLFYVSLLRRTEVTAASGYAGAIAFANLSMSIGTGIAAAALVARNLGARETERARDFATSSLMFSLLISAVLTAAIAIAVGPMLSLIGAQGEAKHLASLFIWTLTPGFILLAGAVCCSFILRGLGDHRPCRAGGLRHHLLAVGIGGADHRAEFRSAEIRSRPRGSQRRPAVRRDLYARHVATAFHVPPRAGGNVPRGGAHRRSRRLLLHLHRRELDLRGGAVRRQRRLQQSRTAPGSVIFGLASVAAAYRIVGRIAAAAT
jgi:hypothetical protein